MDGIVCVCIYKSKDMVLGGALHMHNYTLFRIWIAESSPHPSLMPSKSPVMATNYSRISVLSVRLDFFEQRARFWRPRADVMVSKVLKLHAGELADGPRRHHVGPRH